MSPNKIDPDEFDSYDDWYLYMAGLKMSQNPFKVGDVVHFRHSSDSKAHGKVVAIACYRATSKDNYSCKKDSCTHPDKEHVWVEWPGNRGCSYHFEELDRSWLDIARKRFQKRLETVAQASALGKAVETPEKSQLAKAIATLEESEGDDSESILGVDWRVFSGMMSGIH